MKLNGHFGVAAALALAAVGAAAAAQQPPRRQVTGPVATYWVSAATTSGMGGFGAGGAPSASQMMGQMFGRGRQAAYAHSLTLQLGSSQRPAGAPRADHTAAPALGAGPVLPLLTPERAAPARDPQMPFERPRGKMLIYWGCGEHVGPGQPLTIDFSRIGPGAPVPDMPSLNVRTEQPPSADRFATYGEWPNRRSNTAVPPDGSLAGATSVRGNYAPPIDFTLQPGQDFMPPLTITGQTRTPSGATRLTWTPVQGANGYSAALMGAGEDRGETVVMWSSSSIRAIGWALMDYLPPAEVRRLIADKVVMDPRTTACVIPAEVMSAAPMGMLSMIAYGDEADFVDPPRPADPKTAWNRNWAAKVRFKSTTGVMLGMPGGMGMGDMGDMDMENRDGMDDDGPPRGGRPQPQPEPRRGGLGGMMRGLGGIPIP